MGKSPINSKAKGTGRQTRIMSFNDARRATGRASIRLDDQKKSEERKDSRGQSGAKASSSKKPSIKAKESARSAAKAAKAASKRASRPRESIKDQAEAQAEKKAAAKVRPSLSKAAAEKEAAKEARRAKVSRKSVNGSRKSGRKEMNIARGEARSGALIMMSDEEIEARAEEERQEEASGRKKSRILAFADARKEHSEAKRRARNKAKADKQFDAAYGGDSKASDGESGPRAAVYKAEMGASQKKSAKMQMKDAGNAIKGLGSRIQLPAIALPDMASRLWRTVIGVAIFALFAVAMYGPAQQYYVQMRETDRLQAEYIAVAERSNFLQNSIDSLSSDEGIEDKAHTDLGYVKRNEKTASVKGLNLVDKTEFTSNVAPGSIPAPDTWYSAFLDPIFGYSS